MDQLVKEKINYMVSIEKNSLTTSREEEHEEETGRQLSGFNPSLSATEKRNRKDITETSNVIVKRMFCERVFKTLNYKASLSAEENMKAYIGKEFKTLASYNYQVSENQRNSNFSEKNFRPKN